jgi:hypothetical protein
MNTPQEMLRRLRQAREDVRVMEDVDLREMQSTSARTRFSYTQDYFVRLDGLNEFLADLQGYLAVPMETANAAA